MSVYKQQFGNGIDLVLLHGFGFNSSIWDDLVSQYNLPFRVTMLDLPGFGNSASLSAYSLATVIAEILPHLPEKAIYMGWSLGGLVATAIALKHPERVMEVINVTSSPKFVADNTWPGITAEALNKFTDDLQQDYRATLSRFILLQCHHPSSEKNTIKQLKQKIFSRNIPETSTLLGYLKILQTTDLREDIVKINCKLTYIFGRLDTLVPASVATHITQLTPKITTSLLPQAGHLPFVSHAKLFLATLGW